MCQCFVTVNDEKPENQGRFTSTSAALNNVKLTVANEMMCVFNHRVS
jgi:hypothetical protein